jgi:transcriptional regulator with XRE-family HTH domain
MSLAENLKLIRKKEGLSQDKMATKLGYESINGYAKVERGDVMPSVEKLKKFAEILETDLEALIGSETNHTVNIKGNNHHYHSVILLSETECAHELEKAHLIIEQKTKENELLTKQIEQLQEINALLKKSS